MFHIGWRICASLLLAIFLVCGTQGVAAAKRLEQYYVGVWSIEAYSEEDAADFSHCTMSAEYSGGVDLHFYLGRDYGWGIGLVSENWRLTPGDKYDIVLSIDNGRRLRLSAEAVDPEYVYVAIDGDEDVFNRFRQGKSLVVDAAGDTFQFGLNGTSRGLVSLYDCVEQHVREAQADNKTNPFAPSSRNESEGGNADTGNANAGSDDWSNVQGDYRDEGQRMMANLLSGAGIADYQILPSTEISDAMDGFATVWQGDGVIGGLFVIPEGERESAERILTKMAKSHGDNCAGKFAANVETSARVHGAYMPRAYAGCSDGAGSSIIYFSAFQRRQGGFYVFFTAAPNGGSPNAATDADARIREAAYEVQ